MWGPFRFCPHFFHERKLQFVWATRSKPLSRPGFFYPRYETPPFPVSSEKLATPDEENGRNKIVRALPFCVCDSLVGWIRFRKKSVPMKMFEFARSRRFLRGGICNHNICSLALTTHVIFFRYRKYRLNYWFQFYVALLVPRNKTLEHLRHWATTFPLSHDKWTVWMMTFSRLKSLMRFLFRFQGCWMEAVKVRFTCLFSNKAVIFTVSFLKSDS